MTRWMQERTDAERRAYATRFSPGRTVGEDLDGEARLVDALLDRGSRVLDAGCGTGRVGAALAARGHPVVAVDADPVLIEAGREQHPGLDLRVGDLSTWQEESAFDAVVCAGNVMVFLEPGSEADVLASLRRATRSGGRAIFGFATDREYSLDHFDRDAIAAGWRVEQRWSTWQCHPWTGVEDWAVTVLR